MKDSAAYPRSFGEYVANAHMPFLNTRPPIETLYSLDKNLLNWKFEEADMYSLEALSNLISYTCFCLERFPTILIRSKPHALISVYVGRLASCFNLKGVSLTACRLS